MPFDAPRWQIEIAAADRTASAFQSVDRRMKGLQSSSRGAATEMSAAFGKIQGVLGSLGAGVSIAGAVNLVKQIGDIADEAEKVQLTTDSFQSLTSALRDAGISAQTTQSLLARAAQTLGNAFDGNKDAVELMKRLSVGLIDAGGNAASFEQTLPRVARAILDIENPMQRASAAAAFFGGKVGKEAIPALEAMARGTASLKEQYQSELIPAATIKRFDEFGDALDSLAKQTLVIFADEVNKAFSPATVKSINDASEAWRKFFVEIKSVDLGWLGDINKFLKQTAREAEMLGDAFTWAATALKNFKVESGSGGLTITITPPPRGPSGAAPNTEPPPGSIPPPNDPFKGFPTIKPSGGGSDPYARAIESAKEYTAQKNAETAAIGLNVLGAAKLRHEQELINKASEKGIALAQPKLDALRAEAAAMAEADARLARAKFLDDVRTKADEFIATQQIERDTLYMSAEAAMAYRLEQEAINRATAAGIELAPQDIAFIREKAAAQAASAEQTRKATEWVEFEKQTFKGFFSDLNRSLREGQNIWEAFGNAGENALGKISDKLMDMALDGLWSAAFPGGGRGGGLLGGILGGGASGATSAGLFDGLFSSFFGSPFMFAEGGRPPVGTPYIVGERGPEVRVDGRPGQIFNRRQWNAMSAGGDGGGQRQRIEIVLLSDMLDARIAEGADVRIVRATPRLMSATLDQVPGKMAQHRRDVDGGDHRLG